MTASALPCSAAIRLALACAAWLACPQDRAGAEDLDYERHVLPILMAKCADCHSTRAEQVKAGLKFDDIESFRRSFGEEGTVIPGNWDASPLFVSVFLPSDEKGVMPPKGKGERLNLEEVKLVMRWIAEGAPVGGRRGSTGPMPERFEDLFRDLPPDFAAKLAEELSSAPDAAGTAPASPGGPADAAEEGMSGAPQEWTNRDGRAIQAVLLRLEGDDAVLRLANGTEYRYPLASLSDESQARARKAAGQIQP